MIVAVAVAVVHGRACPSCVWPWWCGRPCPWWSCRGVVAVAVRPLDAITAVADHAVAVAPGRRLGCGGRVAFLCRRHVVATRRWVLVFATVYVVSVLTWFALRLQGVYSESHQANDNERNRDEREATTTETTTARPVTRSPLTGAAWMIEN